MVSLVNLANLANLARGGRAPALQHGAQGQQGALGALGAGEWRLQKLCKRYGAVQALAELSFTIGEGEVVSVTGPSGAGKSTLGRLISGLETPTSGELFLNGMSVGPLPVQARRAAHMFESFALYPTRTVEQNVASPLDAPANAGRWNAAERERRITDVLALTEMAGLRTRLPSQLSGGQKQRVALCRALVQDPSIFILDEPIGHLDAKLRHKMRGEIRRRQGQLRQGTLWLTPDGIEAMAVADRMMVLIGGRVQQMGTPDEVFGRPANVQVARLIGDPAMNVLAARLHDNRLGVGGAAPMPVSAAFIARFAPLARDGALQLGLRPSELRLVRPDVTPESSAERLEGVVYAVEPLGKHTLVTVDVGGQRLRVKSASDATWSAGEPLHVAFSAAQALSFDARTGVLQD
jgi:multiple sugar transport system ATP-binding protein